MIELELVNELSIDAMLDCRTSMPTKTSEATIDAIPISSATSFQLPIFNTVLFG
jgi:hypothetical protein